MQAPDSSPTPAMGLSIAQLSARCRALADQAEKLALRSDHPSDAYRLAIRFAALATRFPTLAEATPGEEEKQRTALLSELELLVGALDRMSKARAQSD